VVHYITWLVQQLKAGPPFMQTCGFQFQCFNNTIINSIQITYIAPKTMATGVPTYKQIRFSTFNNISITLHGQNIINVISFQFQHKVQCKNFNIQ
jgi:hypothetical protein